MRPKRLPQRWGTMLLLVAYTLTISNCRNPNKSDVPDYPVYLDVDIQNEHPGFVPASPCQSLVFTEKRYEYEALGYAGVVVWININGEYRAADLCCPHCLLRTPSVQVNGISAECPVCGEQYDLTTYGFPTKGIAKQPLKSYGTNYTGVKLHVRN